MSATPEFGKRFFCLHIGEGVVAYPEREAMLYLSEETLRKMDPTMVGKPIFRTGNPITGTHIPTEKLQGLSEGKSKAEELDGIAVRSFYNEWDGKHWAEMIVWNDEALRQIEEQGFAVSNSYVFGDALGAAGDWHAVPYDAEVIEGAYDHILITNNPRYQEAKILTPRAFAEYNEGLKKQLQQVTNSKEAVPMLEFLTRSKVEKPETYQNLEVKGPKTGKLFLVSQLVNEKDEMEEKKAKNEFPMADPSHKVKLADNSMCNVGELLEKYHNALNTIKEWEEAAKHNDKKEDETALEETRELEEHEIAEIEADNSIPEEEKEKKKEEVRNRHKAENEAKEKEEKEKAEKDKQNQNELREKAIREKAKKLKDAKDNQLTNAVQEGDVIVPAYMTGQDKLDAAVEMFGRD